MIYQDNSIDACLAVDLYTCDRFMEEDCDYKGNVVLSQDNIADAKHCQVLCKQFEVVGCQYWVFGFNSLVGKHQCLMLDSDERNCSATGEFLYEHSALLFLSIFAFFLLQTCLNERLIIRIFTRYQRDFTTSLCKIFTLPTEGLVLRPFTSKVMWSKFGK